eukprot:98424-Prymnesium_polylepis.1
MYGSLNGGSKLYSFSEYPVSAVMYSARADSPHGRNAFSGTPIRHRDRSGGGHVGDRDEKRPTLVRVH